MILSAVMFRHSLIVLLVGAALCIVCVVGLNCIRVYGIGFFDLTVELRSTTPIRAVSYFNGDFDEPVRLMAERGADPELFDYRRAENFDGKRFVASIKFTDITTALGFERSYRHQGQLALLIEFEGGRKVCKVVDIPAGRGPKSIVVEVD
jgi:hypothetical protein